MSTSAPLVPFVPPRRSGPPIAAIVGASLGLNAVLLLASATPPPAATVTRVVPLPVTMAVATPPPAPATAAAVAPASCTISEAPADPRFWTIGADHLGPFHACDPAVITLAGARALVPALTVAEAEDDEGGPPHLVVTDRRGKHVVTIRPTDRGPSIAIQSPAITTPWGVRVGDRIAKVRDRHRDLVCVYGAAEGEESLECWRSGDEGHGWVDSLVYSLDPAQLSDAQRRRLVNGADLPASAYDRFAVTAIHWDAAGDRAAD